MTENANILTTPSVTPSRHQVVALAYDGLCTFEFGVAVEIFGLPRPEMGDNWYHFAVAAVDEGPLCATGGIRLMTDGGPELLAQADTIVVPAGAVSTAPVPEALCAAPRYRPRPRMPDYFHLFRGVRSRRRRAAQWPPGNDPLALHRGAAVAFPADPGGGGRPLRGRCFADDFRRQRGGDRPLSASGARRISAAKPPTSSPAAWWSLPIATAVRRSRSCAR